MDSLFANVAVPYTTAARDNLGRLKNLYAYGLSAADSLDRREQALLHTLSGAGREPFASWQDDDEVFLYCCAVLLESMRTANSDHSNVKLADSIHKLFDSLREFPTEIAIGGLRALLWCGEAAIHKIDPDTSLPAFWQSYSDSGVALRLSQINQALAEPCSELRASVYDYASRNRLAIRTSKPDQEDTRLRLAVLRQQWIAGTLSSRQLLKFLRDDQSYSTLAMRAALGDESLPNLLAYRIEHDAARILPLAALTGSRAGAELLLEALANPRFSRFAESGWQLVSGRRLVLQPQMRLAGSDRRPDKPAQVGYIADFQQAKRWWREYSCLFDEHPTGVLLGEPLNDRTMLRALFGYGGWLINHLLEVALLRLGWKTAGLSAEQPCYRRRAKLREMSATCLN
ncbi:hypothetical protein LRD18_01975 [Halorhodospira halochloris]|uniref:hypothetical protein n=1 Tax=Halorhodospira halochloris TaxID=1052 RepID=UPI001EE802A4|nr:hypothetical protein [Halorhodospira halochloris]MCG5529642.1 hypothetical protein [Halorhodospira halochloris]